MKNTIFFSLFLLTGTVASAQTDTTSLPDLDSAVVNLTDTSIGKAYVANPEQLLELNSEMLTSAHIFPALGTYTGTGSSTASASITLDENNKGIIWIDGLPQGRFKALMKKAPSTYKIPAQKGEGGKPVQEGSLYVDPATGELTLVLGRPFNDRDANGFLAAGRKKGEWQYTGKKEKGTIPVETPGFQ